MVTPMSDIKPCPFCGEKAQQSIFLEGTWANCANESCQLPIDIEFISSQWNTRPVEDALRGELNQAKEVIEYGKNKYTNLQEENERLRDALSKMKRMYVDRKPLLFFIDAVVNPLLEADNDTP